MVSADLVRGVVLVPVAIAGLAGHAAALGARSSRPSCSRPRRATSRPRTAPPSRPSSTARTCSGRTRSSQATAQALSIGGWARRRRLAGVHPGERLLRRQRGVVLRLRSADRPHPPRRRARPARPAAAAIREGLRRAAPHARRSPPSVIALGVAVTITAGTWIGGDPDARARHAPSRCGRLLDRHGRLRRRSDRERRAPARACRSAARPARACSRG